ncbi:proton-conducting transporter membrane subunit [Oleiphilus sp. HI0132]|uniref:proton-conducting transporter transmembrane domain-containing protein n=1 Tax=Oleiphilus sp. HI0132 TaxID=1822270 RepID=UPI001E3F8073|nr:proton-conducting transporter membrane subunit [Oleiphilus sp. HI0132]
MQHEGIAQVGAWLIFFAFGIKCAFPFMHNWLTDSYPEATPSGTIFLASITAKKIGKHAMVTPIHTRISSPG